MITKEEEKQELTESKMRVSKIDTFGFEKGQQTKSSTDKIPSINIKQQNARIEKWRHMIANLAALQDAKDSLLKKRIRKGIPVGLRIKVWPILAKLQQIKKENPNINFDTLKKSKHFPYEGDILVDLPRTFPDHQLFAQNSIVNAFSSVNHQNVGLKSLMDILKALSLTFDKMGYCQGINFLGAAFLIHMNDEESFWMLYSLMTRYKCISMYENVATIHKQLYVHGELVKQFLPGVHNKLKELDIQHVYYGVNWYMTIFSGYLPFNLFLRVFDIFLNEGWKIIYRTGLAILKIKSAYITKQKDFDKIMDKFRDKTDLESIGEDEFIKIANSFIFSKNLIDKHLNEFEKQNPISQSKENRPSKTKPYSPDTKE